MRGFFRIISVKGCAVAVVCAVICAAGCAAPTTQALETAAAPGPAEAAELSRTIARPRLPACCELQDQAPETLHALALSYAAATKGVRDGDDAQRALAIKQLSKLSQEHPWFAEAHRALGIVHGLRNAWVQAYVAYKHYALFDLHPSDRDKVRAELRLLEDKQPALALYAEAEEAAARRDWPRVRALCAVVIEQKPTFPLAHRLLGISSSVAQDIDAAVASYERYLALAPESPDAESVRAILAEAARTLGSPAP